MPLRLFEILCVVIVVLTLGVMARSRPRSDLAKDYVALAVAAFVGEDTCVRLHRFYAYAPAWDARVDQVPVLVPLIWPLVILSGQDVARALWPRSGAAKRALAVGLLVAADASLVEVVAVRAGLWSWAEPGHLAVPVIGILGWGYFAFAADWILGSRVTLRHVVVVLVAPLATHALITLSWWGLFRWTLRGDLGLASLGALAAISAAATIFALLRRARGALMPIETAAPRMVAAALFVALLVATAPLDGPLWAHAACVAVPYFAVTRYGASRSPGDPSPATPASPRGRTRAAPSPGG